MRKQSSFDQWWVRRMGSPPTHGQGRLFSHASAAFEAGLFLEGPSHRDRQHSVAAGVGYTDEELDVIADALREGLYPPKTGCQAQVHVDTRVSISRARRGQNHAINSALLSQSPSGAVVSADGQYRYMLWRNLPRLDGTPAAPDPSETVDFDVVDGRARTVVFCLINPSTADATHTDPTLSALCGFARRWDKSRIIVVNPFAFRATSPAALARATDPVGPECDAWLRWSALVADTCVVGWGNGPREFKRRLATRAREVVGMLRPSPRLGNTLYCLRVTAKGMPQHPLYLPRCTPLRLYPGLPQEGQD